MQELNLFMRQKQTNPNSGTEYKTGLYILQKCQGHKRQRKPEGHCSKFKVKEIQQS